MRPSAINPQASFIPQRCPLNRFLMTHFISFFPSHLSVLSTVVLTFFTKNYRVRVFRASNVVIDDLFGIENCEVATKKPRQSLSSKNENGSSLFFLTAKSTHRIYTIIVIAEITKQKHFDRSGYERRWGTEVYASLKFTKIVITFLWLLQPVSAQVTENEKWEWCISFIW